MKMTKTTRTARPRKTDIVSIVLAVERYHLYWQTDNVSPRRAAALFPLTLHVTAVTSVYECINNVSAEGLRFISFIVFCCTPPTTLVLHTKRYGTYTTCGRRAHTFFSGQRSGNRVPNPALTLWIVCLPPPSSPFGNAKIHHTSVRLIFHSGVLISFYQPASIYGETCHRPLYTSHHVIIACVLTARKIVCTPTDDTLANYIPA